MNLFQGGEYAYDTERGVHKKSMSEIIHRHDI